MEDNNSNNNSYKDILNKDNITSQELELLIELRKDKNFIFSIVDVRQLNESFEFSIKHTDYLIPTTSFYENIHKIEDKKNTPIIVYCHIGQRSLYCQKILKDMGFKKVINLQNGIAGYKGDIVYNSDKFTTL